MNLHFAQKEEKYWKQVVIRLFTLIRVLGLQNLTLQGTEEFLLKFVECLSLFYPVMNEHLRRVRDKKTYVHYLGEKIQNEKISLLNLTVQEKTLASVRFAKYYSIIFDCTPDISYVEQMTVIVRFVDTSDGCKVREHFFGILAAHQNNRRQNDCDSQQIKRCKTFCKEFKCCLETIFGSVQSVYVYFLLQSNVGLFYYVIYAISLWNYCIIQDGKVELML